MADKRKKMVQGIEVEQVRFGDKWYVPVDQRIKIAHAVDPKTIRTQTGYHVTSVQFVQMGERWAYHCLVEYPVGSGIVKPGSDFIDLKDTAGVAKAETSAIGRALGLHGIASEDGIASAEEMGRGTSGAALSKVPTVQEQCKKLADDLGYDDDGRADLKQQHTAEGKVDWEAMKRQLMREAAAKERQGA